MVINPTIDLGHLINLGGILIGGIFFMAMINFRLKGVEGRLDTMKNVLTELARQDERLTAQDRRIDDLQHGRGFILEGMGSTRTVEPLDVKRR